MSDIGWLVLENVVFGVFIFLAAYFISPWCLFLLLGMNSTTDIARSRGKDS